MSFLLINILIPSDLKPANLMLGGPKIFCGYHKKLLQEEIGVLKIADFGLSKSLKLARPNNQKDNSSKSMDGRKSMDSSNDTSATSPAGRGHSHSAPAYKLTGETGSYRC